jgi:hypothetical protein
MTALFFESEILGSLSINYFTKETETIKTHTILEIINTTTQFKFKLQLYEIITKLYQNYS